MGGGSRSPPFCQMIADITGRPVTACQEVETTCLGAAMTAADAMDDSSDLREMAANMSGEGASYEPDEQRSAFYEFDPNSENSRCATASVYVVARTATNESYSLPSMVRTASSAASPTS